MSARRVLVVDDEQLIRWSVVERLREDGHEVTEAGTAADALERADQGVDLVLLDYKLPDDDGLSVLKKLRDVELKPAPPVLEPFVQLPVVRG